MAILKYAVTPEMDAGGRTCQTPSSVRTEQVMYTPTYDRTRDIFQK